MSDPYADKSTVEQIRARFDADVERFSNLDTGQVAAMDSPLQMELVTSAAQAVTPLARHVLDIGCGAGNYALKLLQKFDEATDEATDGATLDVTLIDLSRPMLDRAVQRLGSATCGQVTPMQSDIRDADLGQARFDIVIAAQCLHHLRGDAQWVDVFSRVFASLRPGGSFWIADSIDHASPQVRALMRRRWSDYLVSVKGEAYRDKVIAYVDREDTPRPLGWQLDLLRRVGFDMIDVLHVNTRFASFGARKSAI